MELSDEALQHFALYASRDWCARRPLVSWVLQNISEYHLFWPNKRLVVVLVSPLPGGGGVVRLIFFGYVPLSFQSPYPFIVYFVANYRPILVIFGQTCTFRDPN